MPGPAVYVAVTVGAMAAVIVFKQFVFDPHVRPKFSAWRDSRRRRRARPHTHSVSSSSSFPQDDGGPQSSQRGTQGKKQPFKRSVGTSDTPHIDLKELIASESLKAGIEPDGVNTGIRQRRVGESQKLRDRPVGNSADISGSSSAQPLISFDDSNISDENPIARPENGPSEQRVVASPPPPLSSGTSAQTPVQAVQQSDASRSGGTPHPLDVRGYIDSQTPVLVETETPHVPETSPAIGLGDILMPIPMASVEPENTRLSFSDTDLFSPSDTLPSDQYLTPHDQTLSPHTTHDTLSPTLSSDLSMLSSPSFSPPGSPFIDAGLYRELMETRMGAIAQRGEISSGGVRSPSPGAADGTQPGATGFPGVRVDSEVFSLPSQVSSDVSSDEGDYEFASLLGSEMSNWMSEVADAEGAAAQR